MCLRVHQWIGVVFAIVAAACGGSTVFGHPGHGAVSAENPLHQVVEPVHSVGWLLVVSIALLLGVVAARLLVRRVSTLDG